MWWYIIEQVLMYTAMKSIFEDKNRQEDLFFKGPGKDLEVRLRNSVMIVVDEGR